MKVGSDRIALYSKDFPDTDTSTPIRVNGKPVVIPGEKLALPGSGAIAKNGNTYAVDFPTGEKVVISPATAGGNTYFNVSFFVYNQLGRYSFSEFARTTAQINGYVETINKLFPGFNIPTPERAINSVIEKVKPKICLPFVGCL